MQLSDKQKEFWNADFHRWNIKHGATRSGKTYLDYFMIPKRIRERTGKDGLVLLLGNTKGTLQRNVIEPMQNIYGADMVSSIRSDNTAQMFGERVHCLGADNIKHVDRVRGMSVKYAYGDEIVTWNEEVFQMLKSRLDKPYSCFDGTCNPKNPDHWVKNFLMSDADIFEQSYTIDDNPFLDEVVREEMKREHSGIFYDRYILGLWTVAEGLVFPYLSDDIELFLLNEEYKAGKIVIGIDFGGNGSATRFCASAFVGGYDKIIVLAEAGLPITDRIDANDICKAYVEFYKMVQIDYGSINAVQCDNASPTMINSLVSAAKEVGLQHRHISGVIKNEVADRPRTIDRMLNSGRLLISKRCKETIKALSQLRWDEKNPDRPEDKNIGNINDIYDAFCYSWITWTDYFDRRRAY